MIILDDVVCKTCEKVFCCSECREKHELKSHALVIPSDPSEPVVKLFCPICQNKPLILHADVSKELLTHITDNHMPLHCQKCSRLYTKAEDLFEFSKCVERNLSCKLKVLEEAALQEKQEQATPSTRTSIGSSVSTQTSPFRGPDINDSHLTPISLMNLRWKAKSKLAEEFISDSVSSIKNISSINNNSSLKKSLILGIASNRGKLVRSTSTPLQAETFPKPKEQAFNVSGGHVSSIYNSASEPESSPPLVVPVSTPSKRAVEAVSRYQKPLGRGKLSLAVTPLRQVMSKSIQKAIAEHGIAAGAYGTGLNRKKMFDSLDSSEDISEKSIESDPIDLRLSPALRRTQSEIIDRQSQLEFLSTVQKAPTRTLRREILLSSTKKTTESIVITSTSSSRSESRQCNSQRDNSSSSSVFQSCRSVEIITSTSTELSEVNIKQDDVVLQTTSGIPPITPRIPSAGALMNKKLIKFETPVVVEKSKSEDKHSPDEKFFTPLSTPVRRSRIAKEVEYSRSCGDSFPRTFYSMEEQENNNIESFGSDYTDIGYDDEVFAENKKPEQGRNRLWSLVASVIRMPSFNEKDQNGKLRDDRALNENNFSIIKRCASFAGSLVGQKSITGDSSKTFKRKRTYTTDGQAFEFACSETKRFRIQGRKPIHRMRDN